MKSPTTISKATIDRLPLYFRTLRLAQDEGLDIISSDELGRRLGITPEGGILGLDNHWNIAIIGIGHLGAALANFHNFVTLGFNLVALFDEDPDVIGTTVNHVKVEDIANLEQIVKERQIHIGIIAVPAAFAQGVADKLVSAGVKGIWNFAPIKMEVPAGMHIVNEDLSVGLSSLSYHITRQ